MNPFLGIIAMVVVGYLTGRYFEKRHYKSLLRREKELLHIPVVTGEWRSQLKEGDEGQLCEGNVVIASDYFKTFASSLRNIFGGRMQAYESLLDRGRREAILRLKEQAAQWNADKVINLRLETATLGNASGNQGLPSVEVFAYGTAVRSKGHG